MHNSYSQLVATVWKRGAFADNKCEMWRPVSAKCKLRWAERLLAGRQQEEAFPKSHNGSCCAIGPIGSLHSDILAPVFKDQPLMSFKMDKVPPLQTDQRWNIADISATIWHYWCHLGCGLQQERLRPYLSFSQQPFNKNNKAGVTDDWFDAN